MSTCGEAGSDVHTLIKEHRSETHSNESRHLAEATEVARLRRRFSFVLQQALSFRTRHHLCKQGAALAGTRQLYSQGPVSARAHCTEGVSRFEGQGGANGEPRRGRGRKREWRGKGEEESSVIRHIRKEAE